MTKYLIFFTILFSKVCFAAKCVEPLEWAQILKNDTLKKITNGTHFVMYNMQECKSQDCDLFVYSKIDNKEGDGKCFSLNRKEKGRYIWGGLQGDSLKLRVDGKVQEFSLKVKKKKR